MKILTVAFMLLFNYLDTLPKLYKHSIEVIIQLLLHCLISIN